MDQVVAGARAGQSQVLVLRGEPGVGKSALVEYLVGSASGCQILRAAGVESEMELAFAGLHQLCMPMMGHLDRLPGPQRDALAIAFGLSAGSAPDRFMVGLAVLSLLADGAEEQPLVCMVDDAQWLDRVSAQTLAFVARRLLAERVALVFAVRTSAPTPGDDPLVALPELVVRGLRDDDARALLDSVVHGRLDERVRDRIVAETRGNPLALLELTRGRPRQSWPAGSGVRTPGRWRVRSSRVSCGASVRCRTRRNGCCWWRPPSRWGTCRCCGGWPSSSTSRRTPRGRPRRRG